MNYFLDKFLREIGRRRNLKFDELLDFQSNELLDILKEKRIDKEDIKKRRKYYAIYFEEGKQEKITDERLIKKLFNLYYDVKIRGKEKIRGLVVSKGKIPKIKGYVKIIENPSKDRKKMKKNDILVAGMTSPDYIVVMRKAKAVITDHGGMTSHAAIISRELGIPCIVKTKIATKMLKDGDYIEVDANKGIVKVLKRR